MLLLRQGGGGEQKKRCHYSVKVPKTINKCFQEKSTIFLEKVQKREDKILGDMVASKLKDLSCSILKVKFKHEVNSSINCLTYNKILKQILPSNHYPAPFSLQLPLLKVILQYACKTQMDCYNTSMSNTSSQQKSYNTSSQWNS